MAGASADTSFSGTKTYSGFCTRHSGHSVVGFDRVWDAQLACQSPIAKVSWEGRDVSA